ncbi:PspA/IM30 family protein [Lysobacter sp. A3-1-A15]|uniref:PspA/IM30 family protein n=1 Tax=Novilysobacter viscosus TaxID=3098602 RepID=UPI002ED771BF
MKRRDTLLARLGAQIADIGDTVRGGVREWNAGRALDDRIHRVDEELKTLRRELDVLKAQRYTAQERHEATLEKIVQREAQAVAALRAGQPALAREVALSIVELESERDAEQALLTDNADRASELDAMVRHGHNALRRLKHELDLLRASEAVASAEKAFAGGASGTGTGIPTAIDSAELLRSRQSTPPTRARPSSGNVPHDPLDEKLQAAGITATPPAVENVLTRLAAQAAETGAAGKEATPARKRRRATIRKESPRE